MTSKRYSQPNSKCGKFCSSNDIFSSRYSGIKKIVAELSTGLKR
jgi:hypothetical protein